MRMVVWGEGTRHAWLAMLVLAAVTAGCSGAKAAAPASREPAFPVPRARPEFDALLPLLDDTGAPPPMDPRLYVALSGPYAPLDLHVTRAADAAEASALQRFWLGVSGAKLGVDVQRLTSGFHCGSLCVARRKAIAIESLVALRGIVATFWRMPNLTILAHWGQPQSFRVNDVYVVGGQPREAEPSAEMGFVPSGRWTDVDFEAAMTAQGLDATAVVRLLGRLGDSRARALVRSGAGSVHAFIAGIGSDRSGVVFQTPDVPAPKVGDQVGGATYVMVERLEPGAFYFETT